MDTGKLRRLLESRFIEESLADEEEIAALWRKAIQSYGDSRAPGLSREGAFKLLYDAGRQASQTLIASSGYRARGSAGHHQSTFAAAAALTDPPLSGLFTRLDRQRGRRHEVEYSAYGALTEAEVRDMRGLVGELINGTASALQAQRPAIRQRIETLD